MVDLWLPEGSTIQQTQAVAERFDARLMREARQLPQYGVAVGAPRLDYPRLLARVDPDRP